MIAAVETWPATVLAAGLPGVPLREFAGVRTAAMFSGVPQELNALMTGIGVYDQGWRQALRITGEDRVRWLNGMVTNTVTGLAAGHWNETFLLNAQGRIQGDAEVYAAPDALLLVTDAGQLETIYQHLDRFIIMDDVELTREEGWTALAVAGPGAAASIASLGLAVPATHGWAEHDGLRVIRTAEHCLTLRMREAEAAALWQRLVAAGAEPCGVDALEALRVLAGRPRFGVDILERHLVQETGRTQALNFSKGCYLGQEIVERVRSRARLNRAIRSFRLTGDAPAPGAPLYAGEDTSAPVGELTSVAQVHAAGLDGIYALGAVRTDAEAGALRYHGGAAAVLARAPLAGQ